MTVLCLTCGNTLILDIVKSVMEGVCVCVYDGH